MAMRDKVSVLPVGLRVLTANLLVDSVGFDEVREALRGRGLEEERMPSDGSFRAFQETAEYKLVYQDRLEREMVAFEAELERPRVPEMKAAAQSRLLRRMLKDLEAGELSAGERVAMWKALSTTEHQEASRADRLAVAEARLSLQAEKVAVDTTCKQRASRTATLAELARSIRVAQPEKRFQHELESVLKGEVAVVASEDPRLFPAISGNAGESGGMGDAAAGEGRAAGADAGGTDGTGGTVSTGGVAGSGLTMVAGGSGNSGKVGPFRGISGNSGRSGDSGDAGAGIDLDYERARAKKAAALTAGAQEAIRMVHILQAREAERVRVAEEEHRQFQAKLEAERVAKEAAYKERLRVQRGGR